MKYTINKDENGFILSVAHTNNDITEITNMDEIEGNYLSCYKLEGTLLVLDETKKEQHDTAEKMQLIKEEVTKLKEELKTYDYIGVKIAMGVATKEDYSEQIAYTETLRQRIRELEND